VTDTNAHLQMSEEFDGLAYDLPLDASPTRAVIEIETGGVRLRAYFFEAGRHEVLTALSTFSGNVSTQLQLVGLTSQLRVERFTMYNFTTGASVADEFDCDTIGMPLAVAWPVSRYAELGTACTTDAECGSSDRCSDGLCRRPCMTSTICGREVCLAHPDGGGFCRLAEAGFCLGDDCPEGLVCGVDRTCRRPCEGGREAGSLDFSTLAGTCPMNYLNDNFGDSPVEHSLYRCVAGACMDNAEYGAIEAGGWGCGYGLQVCMGSGIYQCNMTGPGFQRIAYCGVSADACDYVCQGDDGNEYRCVTGSANPVPRCAACLNTCGQGEDVVNCANQVVVDCDPAFSWCSHGRGGDIRRRLPGDLPLWEAVCEPLVTAAPPGPRTMITPTDTLIPPFEIDRTEVTRAQYMGFVRSDPVVTNAPVECAGNTTLLAERPPALARLPECRRRRGLVRRHGLLRLGRRAPVRRHRRRRATPRQLWGPERGPLGARLHVGRHTPVPSRQRARQLASAPTTGTTRPETWAPTRSASATCQASRTSSIWAADGWSG
jgi:hypothetical protein